MILPPVNRFRLSERRHVVNVFVDLCGSTAAGEHLQDERRLFDLLDRWQRLVAFLFCNYGGRIGASNSDMVMGYFVGTESDQLAFSRAVFAAWRIREKTIEFGEVNKVPLDVHVGLHCGDVEVGLIGPDVRHNLTTIGTPVNIAARLESKADKGEIFVSGDVARHARLHWERDHVGACALKGVSERVDCYRVKAVFVHRESDWVGATIEAQALEEIGRPRESLALATQAVRCGLPEGLSPLLGLLSRELCVRGYLSLRRADEAVEEIRELADCAAKLSAAREQARARFYLAMCLMQQARFLDAAIELEKARRGYDSHGSGRDIADSLYYAGVCYTCLGDSLRARAAFVEARATYETFIDQQEADLVETGKACLELSLLLQDDEPERAVRVLSRAQKIFQDTCQFRHLVTAYLNMSCVAIRMLLFTDAESYARRALELAQDFDPVDGAGMAHGNIGAALQNRGDLAQARIHYEAALKIAAAAGDDARIEQMRQRIEGIGRRRRMHHD
jgi:class 3 adenylate cyclase